MNSRLRRQKIWKGLASKFYLIWLLGISSCSFFQGSNSSSSDERGKKLAQVKENTLFEGDLLGLVPPDASPQDSAALVNRYVTSWIRKQLVLDKAQSSMLLDEAEIQRKVLDYKYDLITYEFQSDYVRKNLDTSINKQDIDEYYQNNQDNFKLRKDIVKGVLVKIPLNTTNINELRTLLASNKREDFPKLREYCIKFAELYHLNDSTWIHLQDLNKDTPLNQITGNDVMLNKGNIMERRDQESIYYLKVNDCVLARQIAPIDFVRNRIMTMIINQRKVQLTKELEQQIFEEGKKNNAFKVYN